MPCGQSIIYINEACRDAEARRRHHVIISMATLATLTEWPACAMHTHMTKSWPLKKSGHNHFPRWLHVHLQKS